MTENVVRPSGVLTTTIDRRALLAVATQFFVNGAMFASFLPRLPEIRDRVDITVTRVGLLLSIAGLFGLAGSAVVSPAISRFGTRTVMLWAATIVAFSLPIIGFAQSELVLIVGLAGMLAFDVPVDVAMNMQGSWLSERRSTPVMSRLHGLWSLGAMVGGIASSRLAAAGVPIAVHLLGASAVLLVVIVLLSRGLLRVDEVPSSSRTTSGTSPTRRSSILALFTVAGFCALAIESTSIDWAAFRFTDDYLTTPGFAALGYVAVTAGMTIGRFGGDWATVRLGRDRLGHAATALSALGLAAATLIDVRAINLGGYALAGVGIATMLPTIYDQAAKLPGPPGAGLGALTAGLRTSSLTVPILVGVLATSLTVGQAIAAVTLPSVAAFALLTRALSSRQ